MDLCRESHEPVANEGKRQKIPEVADLRWEGLKPVVGDIKILKRNEGSDHKRKIIESVPKGARPESRSNAIEQD